MSVIPQQSFDDNKLGDVSAMGYQLERLQGCYGMVVLDVSSIRSQVWVLKDLTAHPPNYEVRELKTAS